LEYGSQCSASYVSYQRGAARIRPPHAAAATWLMMTAVQQSIDISCPRQQTRRSIVRWPNGNGTDRLTDGHKSFIVYLDFLTALITMTAPDGSLRG